VALAAGFVADLELVEGASVVAVALGAALVVVGVQAEVGVLALVALAAGGVRLAGAHYGGLVAHVLAAGEEGRGACRVAAALLAVRVVEEVGRALVALVAGEVGQAFAVAGGGAAGLADGAGHVAVALVAGGEVEEGGRALVALGAAAASTALALAGGVGAGTGVGAGRVAVAGCEGERGRQS